MNKSIIVDIWKYKTIWNSWSNLNFWEKYRKLDIDKFFWNSSFKLCTSVNVLCSCHFSSKRMTPKWSPSSLEPFKYAKFPFIWGLPTKESSLSGLRFSGRMIYISIWGFLLYSFLGRAIQWERARIGVMKASPVAATKE